MMNKEEYEKEIVRMWDSLRTINKGKSSCDGVLCGDCPLSLFDGCSSAEDIFDIYRTVEEWSKEHPQKHKISQLEYDILEPYLKYDLKFYQFKELYALLKKGYFKGATSETKVVEYYNNCEVKEDV